MDRRAFLAQAVPAAATVALLSPGAAAAGNTLTQTSLTDDLTLISGGGGNVTVFNSTEGVLLVDGGSAEHGPDLLKRVRSLTGARGIHTLFNTHWHHDQTGSNTALGPAGTRIIAHENTRLWLGTEVESRWEKRVYPRLPPRARPNQTFYTTTRLDFGGEQIDCGYLPQAHTDGDIYVHFVKANVIVAGDVLSAAAFPIIDYSTNGWIGGMINATQALYELGNDDTRFIAGKGPALTRAQVKEENEMLTTMRQRLAKLLAQGSSVQDMLDARPASDLEARWGDPTLFISNAWPGMVQRARELGVSIV